MPCFNKTQFDCTGNFRLIFYQNNLNEKCPGCPLQCTTDRYSITPSFAQYPTDGYLELILNKSSIRQSHPDLSKSNIKKRLLAFNVFYNELSYTRVTQLPKYESLDLLASMGGFMGLLLGASLMTFVELIEIFFRILEYKKIIF